MSGRSQATALARATWLLGGAFMATSLALTVIAAEQSADSSVVDQINPSATDEAPTDDAPAFPDLGGGGSLLPPSADTAPATDAPLVPSGD